MHCGSTMIHFRFKSNYVVYMGVDNRDYRDADNEVQISLLTVQLDESLCRPLKHHYSGQKCKPVWGFLVSFGRILRCSGYIVYSRLVISNSKGLSEILRDIRTSTYQICRIEEKLIRLTTFNKYMCNLTPEVRDILKILWKRGENFSSFPQNFLTVVRFSSLGRDQIFTSR